MAEEEKKPIEAWQEELYRLATIEDWRQVEQRAEACIEQHPDKAFGYHIAIVAAIKLNNEVKAIQIFQLSAKNKITNETILLNVFPIVINQADNYALANMESAITQVLISTNDLPIVFRLHRGTIRAMLDKFREAIEDFTLFLDERPDNSEALKQRGMAYYDLKQMQLALVDLNKAISLDSTDKNAFLARANIYTSLDRGIDAIIDYGKALALDAKFTKAYIYRGLSYYHLNCFAEGLDDFETAHRLDSKNQDTILQMIYGYEMLDKPQNIYPLLAKIDGRGSLNLYGVSERVFKEKIASLDDRFNVIKHQLPREKSYDYYSFLLFLMALYESTLEHSLKYFLRKNFNCEPKTLDEKVQGRNAAPFICINLIKNLLKDDKLREFKKFIGQERSTNNCNGSGAFLQLQEARKIRNDVIHGNGYSNGNSPWNSLTRVTKSQCVYACGIMLELLSQYIDLFQSKLTKSKFNPLENSPQLKRPKDNKMNKVQTKYFLDGLYATAELKKQTPPIKKPYPDKISG